LAGEGFEPAGRRFVLRAFTGFIPDHLIALSPDAGDDRSAAFLATTAALNSDVARSVRRDQGGIGSEQCVRVTPHPIPRFTEHVLAVDEDPQLVPTVEVLLGCDLHSEAQGVRHPFHGAPPTSGGWMPWAEAIRGRRPYCQVAAQRALVGLLWRVE
jgi:hypothetical protein